jgi:ribosomal protein L11 methyltransferase
MTWLEVSLVVDGEAAEAAADLLQRYAYQGVALEAAAPLPEAWPDEASARTAGQPLVVRAYLPDDAHADETRARIEAGLRHLGRLYPMPRPTYRLVEEENWAEAWKAHYHPIRVGRRILIHPRWREVTAGRGDVVISLDPGMAFGTGTHPSTQLCLVALEDYLEAGDRALDLGSGSGVLSIAAAKLGAHRVLALDTNPIAVRTTRENARANGVGRIVIARQGSLESVLGSPRRWDLTVVNILAEVILAFCRHGLGTVARPGGVLIAAGIIEEQVPEVHAALETVGLPVVETRQIEDWVALICRRPHN